MEQAIRIGTLVNGNHSDTIIPQIVSHGFESFNLTFWQLTGQYDLKVLAARLQELSAKHGFIISAISVFGNPLTGTGDNADTLAS